MKKILERLFNHSYLSYEESKKILKEISSNKYNDSQVASFLTIFKMRNPSVQEIEGFRDALLDLCVKIDISSDFETIDLCGTGGDGKNTFNISTISSFVVAGAGYKVTKHGNYGVSSNCGSSDVLEYLGVRLSNDQDYLKKCLDVGGFCYLHAPLFHPAMKNVASVRKELKFKTFFNILGPLVNPCQPKNQLSGVYNLEIARLYGYVFENTNKKGVDGVIITAATKSSDPVHIAAKASRKRAVEKFDIKYWYKRHDYIFNYYLGKLRK